MPKSEYAASRTDGAYIGAAIKEVIRQMLDGVSWQLAADAVGLKRASVYKALHKQHVIAYRREERQKLIELLSSRVPLKLSSLMDSENAAAAVRASLALEEMNNDSRAEPTRRISTGGILIVLNAAAQRALPTAGMPVLEMEPADE